LALVVVLAVVGYLDPPSSIFFVTFKCSSGDSFPYCVFGDAQALAGLVAVHGFWSVVVFGLWCSGRCHAGILVRLSFGRYRNGIARNWGKSVPGLILVGAGNKSKLYRVMTQQVPRKLIQTRVLTSCPLCGFRQRLERLTGGEYHVTDLGDLLPLEVAAIYAEKRAHGLVCEFRDLRLKPGQRAAMLEALAAKVLPLVRLLSVEVPEFREALEAEEFMITLGVMPLEDSLPLKNFSVPLKLPMSRDVPEPRLSMPLKLPMAQDVPESWLKVNEWQTEKSPMSLTTEMPPLELPMTGVPKVKRHRRGST